MGVWETDDEYLSGPAATSLPTPLDTPYRTPSRTSKKSRRSITPPDPDSSPPQLPNEMGSKRSSRNVTTDENISILDPRRFTPTLHANLVSEILNLRRDQEEKIRQIETLEASLHATKEEKDTLKQSLTDTGKESRSLKRQLSLLEGGSSSALGELARERDDAVESVADTRKRLETAQKKIRIQEEDSVRVHDQWAEEKEGWENERRKFEHRLHVAETRLKTVLDEVAAYQQSQLKNVPGGAHHAGHDSEAEESGRENDAASIRTMSMTNSVRFSFTNGLGALRLNGNSLADELNFDDEDEQSDFDNGRESAMSNYGRESAMSNYGPSFHARNLSRDSPVKRFHARNQSLESIKRTGSVTRGRLFMNPPVPEALEDEENENELTTVVAPKVSYTDTGIQYSPPPSPKLTPVKPATPERPTCTKTSEVECSPRADGEIEANQRRKRVHRPLSLEPTAIQRVMVSASVQTNEEPLVPPMTPKSPTRPPPPPPVQAPVAEKPLMVTSFTQTDSPPRPLSATPGRLPSPPPLAIPSISVHPPSTRPSTPKEPRLPVLHKDFGCQVRMPESTSTAEAGVQTEGIQTDKRMALLPPHLQPSAISSRPSSPNPSSGIDITKSFTPVPGNVPPRNPRRLERLSFGEQPSSPISLAEDDSLHDIYPGNNDDGPLSGQKAPMRRPHRFSSLFAGFDGGSSDEADDFGDADLSDLEYRTALSAPRPKSISSRPGKRSSTGTTETYGTIPTSPEQVMLRQGPRVATELHQPFTIKSGKGFEKGPAAMAPNRASVMRKSAMIQSGITSHQGPNSTDTKNPPPFPIPTRASSRNVPTSTSAPSDGQRSPTRGDFFQRRGSGRVYRAGSVRKVRSAAALPRHHRHRKQDSRSSAPLSPSTEAPESPSLPPLPRNDITTPRTRARHSGQYKHQHKLSTNTDNTFNTYNTSNTYNTYNTGNTLNTSSTDPPPSTQSAAQNTSVVDAIAQTMVGEWMFKYVRRRKSFGMPESNGKDDTGNDRHKRWVWLAPYERAILWSSKQPASGTALMGKPGRKLTIQSVLDVKDDNPPPKGTTSVFNRSILILTPQRALKFTAESPERHYIWLTALSFLAHSSQAVPENIPAPPKIQQTPLPDFEAPQPKLKRGGIRDSIRLAKGRTVGRAAPPSVPSIPSVPSSQLGDAANFPAIEPAEGPGNTYSRDDSIDAAQPPLIPRFHDRNQPAAHGRKRSNTGGHVPPPLSFRGFSGPITGHQSTNSTAGNSTGTADSSDIYQSQPSNNGAWAMSQTGSQRTSEASSRPGNFFDAIGTVRMEAFISPLAFSQFNDYPDEQDEFRHSLRRRSKEQRRRQSRSRHRDSYNSRSTRTTNDDYYHGSRTAGEEDYFRDDPFRGF